MRTAALLLCLVSIALLGAANPREASLEALKKAFPKHSAGEITDKSDPLNQDLYFKYKQQVDSVTLQTLPSTLGHLRRMLDYDLLAAENSQNYLRDTASMRHARRQNAGWLRQKLAPYIARLESLQRGR